MTHNQAMAGLPVLVTGANGFIGSWVASHLVNLNAEVHLFLRGGSERHRLQGIEGRVKLWHGDIANFRSVHACVAGVRPRVIFHLAAARDVARDISLLDAMVETNIRGTLNIFRAVAETGAPVECIVNTGSSEEYGNGQQPFVETQREQPVSPYSASKAASTHFGQMLYRSMGLPVVTLRPFLAYGPGQADDMFIPSLIRHCIEKQDFAMTSGDQTRDFVYVGDVADAYVRAAFVREALGEVINIGSSIEYSIREVAEMIVAMMGHPIRLLVGALPKRAGETDHFYSQCDKARRILGWVAQTGLHEGLQQTILRRRESL